MNIIYLLLPVALVLVVVIIWVFFWAVKSDQFDDMEGPAHQILMDDDEEDRHSKSTEADDNRSDGS